MSEENKRSQMESMQILVELSEKRTQQSAERSYMNAERTLSVWLRTALAVMIFGIAIDRLGLLLKQVSTKTNNNLLYQNTPSTIIGAILVGLSMFMAISAGLRFIGFAKEYKKEYSFPSYHNSSLPVAYSFLILIFGAALLFLMLFLK